MTEKYGLLHIHEHYLASLRRMCDLGVTVLVK